MKTQRFILSGVCILSIAIVFSSCKKNEPQPPLNYEKIAEDISVGDQVYSDIFRAVNNESGNVQSGDGKEDGCGLITTSGYANNWPLWVEGVIPSERIKVKTR